MLKMTLKEVGQIKNAINTFVIRSVKMTRTPCRFCILRNWFLVKSVQSKNYHRQTHLLFNFSTLCMVVLFTINKNILNSSFGSIFLCLKIIILIQIITKLCYYYYLRLLFLRIANLLCLDFCLKLR